MLDPKKNAQAFYKALREEHHYACRAVLLDTDFKEVDEDTLLGGPNTNAVSNFISDGSVDVDTTRGMRRTAELTLLNPTAEFTPARDNRGGWVGKIYVNRVIRLYRGLYLGGQLIDVPIGTFMIDQAEIIVERNMSLVNLTMSDFWKKLQKSYAAKDVVYAAGTPYHLIVDDIIQQTASDYPLPPILDELLDRPQDDRTLSSKLTLSEGDSRGDWLKDRAKEWDVDVYFDPKGQFYLQDRKKASDKAVVWHYYSSENRSGMLLNVQRTYNDDNIYNHVVVVGSGDRVIRKEKSDTDPQSEISIQRIGDRVWLIKDDKIKTEAQVQRALDKAWENHYQWNETIQWDAICNPALEGDDVIAITEKTFSKTGVTAEAEQGLPGNAYRLQRFNVPLVTTRQTLQANNIWKSEDFRDYISN